MSDDKRGFTVKDRRQFTPDGEPRDAVVESDEAQAPGPGRAPDASAQPAAASGLSAVASAPSAATGAPPAAATRVDFPSFLVSLGAQAGALVSQADLDGARQIISILEMLQDKTQGRRTAEEEQILEGLLYQLRMAYVEASQVARK